MDRLCRYVEFFKIILNIFPLFTESARRIFEKRLRESSRERLQANDLRRYPSNMQKC